MPLRSWGMVASFLSPLLAGSALAGVALGVYLGESAIGLIDPIHFQGAAVHPRDRGAAIDPHGRPQAGPIYADLYGWEDGEQAFATDCGDCESFAEAPAAVMLGMPPFAPSPDHSDVPQLPAREAHPEPAPAVSPRQDAVSGVDFAAYSDDDPGEPGESIDGRALEQE